MSLQLSVLQLRLLAQFRINLRASQDDAQSHREVRVLIARKCELNEIKM